MMPEFQHGNTLENYIELKSPHSNLLYYKSVSMDDQGNITVEIHEGFVQISGGKKKITGNVSTFDMA